jgi:ribonuclease R
LLTFLEDKIDLEMDATITGVERFGLFCQGVEIPADGLIHISALERDDHYDFDEATFSLVARRSGRRYRLGDNVRVRVAHVDVDRRGLDFRIVPEGKKGAKKEAAAPPRPPQQRHPRSKRAERLPAPEESPAIRARRREKKRRRADRRGDNGERGRR